MTHTEENTQKINEVWVITRSFLNQPIVVEDKSKPTVEEVTEDVKKYELDDNMHIISKRVSPFTKEEIYTVKYQKIIGYHVVGVYYNYSKACYSARLYAKKNGLKVWY